MIIFWRPVNFQNDNSFMSDTSQKHLKDSTVEQVQNIAFAI